MAHQSSMSNGAPIINIQSLPYNYLRYCVKIAQEKGLYPDNFESRSDTNISNNDSCSDAHSWSVPSSLDSTTDHQDPKPNESNSHDSDPLNSSTFADTHSPEHGDDHNNNFSISNDDAMDIDTDILPNPPSSPLPQASTPPTDHATIPSLYSNPHSTSAPTELPEETLQTSNTSEEPGVNGLAILHNYDPLWVKNTGTEPSTVFESYSKMKFEQLFIDGVILKGDRLIISYTTAFSQLFEKDTELATLTVRDSFQTPPLIFHPHR